MSGGTFDYIQYRFEEIVDRIEEEIKDNTVKPEWLDDDEWDGHIYTDETIAEFKKAIEIVKKAQVYVHCVDWLLAGDDGEESFHERLSEDLAKLNQD